MGKQTLRISNFPFCPNVSDFPYGNQRRSHDYAAVDAEFNAEAERHRAAAPQPNASPAGTKENSPGVQPRGPASHAGQAPQGRQKRRTLLSSLRDLLSPHRRFPGLKPRGYCLIVPAGLCAPVGHREMYAARGNFWSLQCGGAQGAGGLKHLRYSVTEGCISRERRKSPKFLCVPASPR